MSKIQVWTLFWTLLGKKISAVAMCIELPPIFLGALSCFFPLNDLRHNIARSALALSEVGRSFTASAGDILL